MSAAPSKLEQVLTAVAGERLVILISGSPDPDAIGSALAHRRICERLGVEATIAHVHRVAHRENRALVKLLDVPMVQVSSREQLEGYQHLSLVDTSTPEPAIELPESLHLLTVVDHHRATDVRAPFVDIRTSMGATASMYAEYMQGGLAPLEVSAREDGRVATGLLVGIQTDTDNFRLASAADFAAAAYVRNFSDGEATRRVGRTIGAPAMNVVARALRELVVVRDLAFAGVGLVSGEDRDAIGTAADFILRREDIDTVFLYGIVDDHIDGSLRTDSPSVDPAAFLRAAFGEDPSGRPYGGGRADKGAVRIPLGVLAETRDKAALWSVVTELVRTKLARVVPEMATMANPPQG